MQIYKPKVDVPILEDEVPPHQEILAITSLELPPPGSLVAFRHKVGYLLGLVEGSAYRAVKASESISTHSDLSEIFHF